MDHVSMLQLTIAYVFVGVITFTAVVTALSLVGWVEFAEEYQQRRLFWVLIVEIVVVAVGVFSSTLKLDPNAVAREVGETAVRDTLEPILEIMDRARTSAEEAGVPSSETTDRLAVILNEFHLDRPSSLPELVSAHGELNEVFTSESSRALLPFRDLFSLRGDIAFALGEFSEAVESYEVALRVDPGDVELLLCYGYVARKLFRYEEAESAYRAALERDRLNFQAVNGMQNCLRRYGAFLRESNPEIADSKFTEALEFCDSMRNLAANDTETRMALSARARLYWEWERFPQAIAEFERLTEHYPDYQPYKEDLAAILVESGDKSSILRGYSLYSSLHDDELESGAFSVFVAAGLAEAAAKSEVPGDELQVALDAALRATAESSNDPFNFYALALVQYRSGSKSEATESLRQAIRLEKKRSLNPYTFDYQRLALYEVLLASWTSQTTPSE